MKMLALVPVTLLVAGCGPMIGETRMAFAPPRAKDCQLTFVQATMAELSPIGGKYQVLGYVTLGEVGIRDPFSERYRAVVRPRACSMGGEAVSIAVNATNVTAMGNGSSTAYAVLRAAPLAPAQPAPF